MKFREMVRVALEGVWVNKLRSLLTMLGIIIGVMSVIIIVTLGQSLEARTKRDVETLGANTYTVVPIANDSGEKGKITLPDCKLIRESIESVELVIPLRASSYPAALETERKKKTSMLVGTSQDYTKVSNLGLSQGRFFTNVENSMDRRVVVIDEKIAAELFGVGNQAVDKTIKINSQPFLVVGVVKPEAPILGMQFEYSYIPVNAMLAMENTQELQQILVRVSQKEQLQPAIRQTVKILEMRHDIKKGFQADTNEQMMKQIDSILTTITSVVGALAGIALVVGGIGIMNIMLVSVTERTREIGIRIAVGARRRDILTQFLVESAVISILGGIVGMILGIGIGALISMALKMPVVVSIKVILVAFFFSGAIGVGFGMYPANRASRLDPIDALRYE